MKRTHLVSEADWVTARGSGEVIGTYMILDLMPKGRNESGAMDWIKRHDEYDGEKKRKAG